MGDAAVVNVAKMRRHVQHSRSLPLTTPSEVILCPSCGEWLPMMDAARNADTMMWPYAPHDCAPCDLAEVWKRFCDGPTV